MQDPLVDLRQAALACFLETDPESKAAAVDALQAMVSTETLLVLAETRYPAPPAPGRPPRPELVPPSELERRGMRTSAGRAATIHAFTHIEFNAINLALDAIWRYPDMPRAFYLDWLRVAAEEALHFKLLAGHLQTLGYRYGDFPAHNGLWDMAERTSGNLLARLALVPRTLEARGLDVTPGLRAKLLQAGDTAAAAILDIILRDEIGHVHIGNTWYVWLCGQQGLAPESTYQKMLEDYRAPALRGPFNLEARRAAGFSESELAALQAAT